MDPVIEILVCPGSIAGMPPETGRLVADAVHVEGVQPDFSCHLQFLKQDGMETAIVNPEPDEKISNSIVIV
jgi:hypothetical protein